jgi:ParB family chromosome partitioning protein
MIEHTPIYAFTGATKREYRDIEKLIKDMNKEPKNKEVKKPQNDFIYRDMEEQLKNIMGTKVVIHNKDNNKGKIEIEYYSQDDFERIMELIKK